MRTRQKIILGMVIIIVGHGLSAEAFLWGPTFEVTTRMQRYEGGTPSEIDHYLSSWPYGPGWTPAGWDDWDYCPLKVEIGGPYAAEDRIIWTFVCDYAFPDYPLMEVRITDLYDRLPTWYPVGYDGSSPGLLNQMFCRMLVTQNTITFDLAGLRVCEGDTLSQQLALVPEPGPLVLMCVGLTGLLALGRKKLLKK